MKLREHFEDATRTLTCFYELGVLAAREVVQNVQNAFEDSLNVEFTDGDD